MNTENRIAAFVHAGLFETDEDWIHPCRTESTYEIICVLEGKVHIEECGLRYSLGRGDVMLLLPGKTHFGYKESSGTTSFYWVHFNTSDFDALSVPQGVIHGFNGLVLFRQLLHAENTMGYPRYGLDALLESILAEIASCSFAHSSVPGIQHVKKCAEWIRINSDRNLSVSGVAARYGYNAEHFSRMFRSVYSVGLKDYIISERLKAAQNLLCNSSYSIKQISRMLNFRDANDFIHFFKYHQKQTPSSFRKTYTNFHMNKK